MLSRESGSQQIAVRVSAQGQSSSRHQPGASAALHAKCRRPKKMVRAAPQTQQSRNAAHQAICSLLVRSCARALDSPSPAPPGSFFPSGQPHTRHAPADIARAGSNRIAGHTAHWRRPLPFAPDPLESWLQSPRPYPGRESLRFDGVRLKFFAKTKRSFDGPQ